MTNIPRTDLTLSVGTLIEVALQCLSCIICRKRFFPRSQEPPRQRQRQRQSHHHHHHHQHA